MEMRDHVNQYISDNYREDEIKFDIKKIKLTTIDIEVASEEGFPDVESAAEEVLLITVQELYNKRDYYLGSGTIQVLRGTIIHCNLIMSMIF